MSDPLAGSAAKVKRAALHLETLHTEIRQFVESEPKPYRFVSTVDKESARHLVRLRIERDIPLDWSLIAGDFVQNARAALDHLVWQLVRANGQAPTRRSAFPILDQRPTHKRANHARKQWNAMLAGVHPAAVNFVESCQPYHGDAGPAYHVLTTLRVLSNEDKHRTLLPAFTAIEGRPELIDLKVVGVRDVREPVERGQVYARRPLNDLDVVLESAVEITGPDPEVRMEGELPLDVAFGSKRMPLGGLRQMVDMIAAVIAEARVFFGQ